MDKDYQHICGLKHGDEKCFERLYAKWSGKLYNFVMRVSKGDDALAKELVQSVFVQVWETRASLDPAKSFGAYLCTIAKNMLVNIYQHRMVEYAYQQKMQETEAADNGTEDDVNFHLLEEYVNTLIERLPPARREIFILSRYKLLTNKEIADRLGLSVNTVESQLTKAFSFLRKELGKHYPAILLLWAAL